MNTSSKIMVRLAGRGLLFLAILAPVNLGQEKANQRVAAVEGRIYDSQGAPLTDSTVSLENGENGQALVTHSDESGNFRFTAVPSGKYMLRASKTGYSSKTEGPFAFEKTEWKTIELHLLKDVSLPGAIDKTSAVQFSDEPQFQVAGIADPSQYGGHGSDTVLRTKEALAKDTVSLNPDESNSSPNSPTNSASASSDAATPHRQKGDEAEVEGRPLDAVREYQIAAELEPSEANLFAWGAELLLHRAYEPAIEVFSKGQRLFPNSVRMLLGLGIATYDQGATEHGEQLVLRACDLNPTDPEPYLFLGRLQDTEKIEPPGWTEKLQQFVNLHPDNAMAHYYYAVALSKQKTESKDYAAIQAEFEKAVKLDPQLGKADLQLGILYSEKKDFPAAIRAFEKAIGILPLADEAHYRLAQIYRQMGDAEKARQEMKLYNETSQEKMKRAEEQRHEIQQFVYTLRGQKADSTTPNSKPQ